MKGHHIKVIREIYLLLFSKKNLTEQIPQFYLWRYYKAYCDSLNKILLNLLCYEKDKSGSIQNLLDTYSHTMLKWAKLIHESPNNSQKQIELYLLNILLLSIIKSRYYYRLNFPDKSAKILENAYPIYTELSKFTLNHKSLKVCTKFILEIANVLCDLEKYEDALNFYFKSLKHAYEENVILCKNHKRFDLIIKNLPIKSYHIHQNVFFSY